MLRALAIERPGLRCQLLSIGAGDDPGAMIEREASSGDADVRVYHRQRRVRSWRPCEARPAPGPWRDGGVYLITRAAQVGSAFSWRSASQPARAMPKSG